MRKGGVQIRSCLASVGPGRNLFARPKWAKKGQYIILVYRGFRRKATDARMEGKEKVRRVWWTIKNSPVIFWFWFLIQFHLWLLENGQANLNLKITSHKGEDGPGARGVEIIFESFWSGIKVFFWVDELWGLGTSEQDLAFKIRHLQEDFDRNLTLPNQVLSFPWPSVLSWDSGQNRNPGCLFWHNRWRYADEFKMASRPMGSNSCDRTLSTSLMHDSQPSCRRLPLGPLVCHFWYQKAKISSGRLAQIQPFPRVTSPGFPQSSKKVLILPAPFLWALIS